MTAKRVKRYDRQPIQKAKRLDNGFLKAPVVATRIGVFAYRLDDGTVRRELRHPDEVFNQDSLETMKGLPVTNLHPSVLVTSQNAKELTVGYTSDSVEHDDKFVRTSMTLTHADAIADVDRGRREVSMGYECEVEETPGVYNGEHYDAIQRGIVYNHMACVDRGRAGRDVRVHLDHGDAEFVEPNDGGGGSNPPANNPEEGKMKITLDGIELEVSDAVGAAILRMQQKHNDAFDAQKKRADDAESSLAAVTKDRDTVQAKHDALEKDVKQLREDGEGDKFNERVKARVQLVSSASSRLDKETVAKLDGMSDREIKVAVIKADDKDFDDKDRSDDYVAARFDVAIAKKGKKDERKLDDALGDHAAETFKTDSGEELTADQIRERNMKRDSEAYKNNESAAN